MPISVEKAALAVLGAVAKYPRDKWVTGPELAADTGLSPGEINDAVTILEEAGNIEWIKTIGTAPFQFRQVQMTARGRYEFERAATAQAKETGELEAKRPPAPIGSPYGFQDEDWEVVALRKGSLGVLHVVMGHQFSSTHFNSDALKANVHKMFKEAVTSYNKLPGATPVTLDFRPLAAGYGEHLFNEIARDVIGANIAVFETSDLNPNVMVEIGVALTWGVRVLPIKVEGCSKPPSDISGQTWADYRDSGAEFADPEHHSKLVRMVERAARKKGRGAV